MIDHPLLQHGVSIANAGRQFIQDVAGRLTAASIEDDPAWNSVGA